MKNWKKVAKKFIVAQSISLFGSSIVQYGIIWYLTLETGSAKILTLTTLCGFLPQMLISFFSGTLIDKYNRKSILIVSDSIIAISTFLLAISFFLGERNYNLLFVVLIIRSFGTGVQTPTVNTIIPQIVPEEKLFRVNGIYSTISSVINFLSPVISGIVLSLSTIEFTLMIDIITAIIGILITITLNLKLFSREAKNKKNDFFIELKFGIMYIIKNKSLKYLFLYQFIILFLISPSAFLNPLLVNRTFGMEVWRFSFTEMTYSFGMILGGIFITKLKKDLGLKITLLSGIMYGLFMVGLGSMRYFILYLLINTMMGFTSPCYSTPIITTIQRRVDNSIQGRVFSFFQIVNTCSLPLGMSFFGPIADIIRIQDIFVISGILVIILSLVFHIKNILKIES